MGLFADSGSGGGDGDGDGGGSWLGDGGGGAGDGGGGDDDDDDDGGDDGGGSDRRHRSVDGRRRPHGRLLVDDVEAATALAIAASTADASGRGVAVRDARRIGASSVG